RLDPKTNTMVVGSEMKNFASGLNATEVNWISGQAPSENFEALVKIRYKHEPAPAFLHVDGNQVKVKFKEPQRAVTPGQAAVFYQFDAQKNAREVLGGGKITAGIPYE
ncbi:MAG: aminomethyltransferase beta-barrel domain-containing protein, partial [Elusimicrobiota bacterium]